MAFEPTSMVPTRRASEAAGAPALPRRGTARIHQAPKRSRPMVEETMWRNVLAIPAGLVVMGVTVMGLQWVGSSISPLPLGVDPMDPADAEAFAEHLASLPLITWVIAFLSELVGALL